MLVLAVGVICLAGVAGGSFGVGALPLGIAFLVVDVGLFAMELAGPLIFGLIASLMNVSLLALQLLEKSVEKQVQVPVQPQPQQQPEQTPEPQATPNVLVDPFPIDPTVKKRDKDHCEVGTFERASALYGEGFAEDVREHHPVYWCYILMELLDIDEETLRRFGGLTELEANLRLGESSARFKGAFFELQWVHDHLSLIASLEPVAPDGDLGPDAIDIYGDIIDLKSYDSKNIRSNIEDLEKQIERFIRYYVNRVIYLIFDANKLCSGKLPNSIVNFFVKI
ncbi:hypothetical protein [Thermogemmatispora onikobensis]|uniref:hypothetical protein n=1 Tax=Thermogemmatispora onikobensis TaxID=732234 RepID=UPI0008535A15|nr:hypothetical protein [Thermogemmatispora onikobensis]